MNGMQIPLEPVLVCDLDGTLVNSLPDLADALSDLLRDCGRRAVSEAEVSPLVGDGVPPMVERAFALTGDVPADLPDQIARYVGIYETRMTELTKPYPGVLEALAALRDDGWRVAVCTNKPEHASRGILTTLGFDDLVEAVAGGDTYPVKKPDPGHILRLLEALGGRPDAAVMLGDSENDVAAGRAAGLPVVAFSQGYGAVPARDLGADRVIDHFDELPGAVAALMDANLAAGS